MKLQPGNIAEESSTPQNSLPQSYAGRERDQQSANGDASSVTEAPQSCWWEAGWFKEWERSAQPAQKRSA